MGLVTPEDLSTYYSQPGYADAWKVVEDYNELHRYAANHPNKGSTALASALEMPRGRVQSWLSDSRPTVVRAIQIAERKEWIPLTSNDEQLAEWTGLVAWIYARGTISEDEFAPMFGIENKVDQQRLTHILNGLDIKSELYHAETTERATELRLTSHRAIVGRILVELGAPLGSRKETRTVPRYIRGGASELQAMFAAIYLVTIAEYWEWREGYIIHQDEYPSQYWESLASVFEGVIPEDLDRNTIDVNEDSLFVASSVADTILDTAPDEYFSSNTL